MQQFFQYVQPIGIAVVGIILVYKEFRSGDGDLKKRITSDYKERNDQLEQNQKGMEVRLREQEQKLSKMEGVIEEKDKQIEKLNQIILDKNPETLAILKKVSDLLMTIHENLEQSSKELTYQTQILEKTEKRNKTIDQATATHKGEVLRSTVTPETVSK